MLGYGGCLKQIFSNLGHLCHQLFCICGCFLMKSNHSNSRQKATSKVNKKQPRPFVLALMLTGVLALKSDSTLLKSALVHSKAVLSDSITVTQKPSPMENQRLWEMPQKSTAVSSITPTYRVLTNPLFKHQGQSTKTIPVIYAKNPLNPEWAVNIANAAKVLPPTVDKKFGKPSPRNRE